MSSRYLLPSFYIILTLLHWSCQAFVLAPSCRHCQSCRSGSTSVITIFQTANGEEIKGDPFRAATGIRPSLHPTTINAIAEALKIRASNNPEMPLMVTDNVRPLDVALAAGRIAATAIEKRQISSQTDGMTLTPEEGQTIAGRVVGVVMRFQELEGQLYERVSSVSWVKKYGEWTTFGVLEDDERNAMERIRSDPFFALCRAECLLAIFLHTVESPQIAKIGTSLPGGSAIDFLDGDRKEVLLILE